MSRYHMVSKMITRRVAGYYGQQEGYWTALWVSPDGEVYDVKDTHHAWAWDNREMLQDKDADIDEWYEEQLQDAEMEAMTGHREELIKERAWESDIDESEVRLSEKDEEEIMESASETAQQIADRSIGVAMVDYLIKLGWIRVAQRTAIHFEANHTPRLYDRCEAVLTERFPDVWKQDGRIIVVNDEEINSGDLQQYGNLGDAIKAGNRRNLLLSQQR